jgi:hypothetical protein
MVNPAVHGDVIDLDPTLHQEFFDIAIGESEPWYQRTARTITSGGNRKPLKPNSPRREPDDHEIGASHHCRPRTLASPNATVP